MYRQSCYMTFALKLTICSNTMDILGNNFHITQTSQFLTRDEKPSPPSGTRWGSAPTAPSSAVQPQATASRFPGPQAAPLHHHSNMQAAPGRGPLSQLGFRGSSGVVLLISQPVHGQTEAAFTTVPCVVEEGSERVRFPTSHMRAQHDDC